MDDLTINSEVTMSGENATVLAGRYRIVRQLGQGGMGSVWGWRCILRRFPSDYGWGAEGIVRIGRERDIAALVIHGMADEVIPFSHGQAVFRQISSKYKRFVPVDGAGHCDFQIVLGEKYVPLLRDFILKKDYNVGAKRTVGRILNWFGYSGKMD